MYIMHNLFFILNYIYVIYYKKKNGIIIKYNIIEISFALRKCIYIYIYKERLRASGANCSV